MEELVHRLRNYARTLSWTNINPGHDIHDTATDEALLIELAFLTYPKGIYDQPQDPDLDQAIHGELTAGHRTNHVSSEAALTLAANHVTKVETYFIWLDELNGKMDEEKTAAWRECFNRQVQHSLLIEDYYDQFDEMDVNLVTKEASAKDAAYKEIDRRYQKRLGGIDRLEKSKIEEYKIRNGLK